jgi:glucan biosynthesis protein C
VMNWPLHWSIKFPLILVIAFTLLLASYHWLVRYTFIGAVLSGARRNAKGERTSRNALAQ